jgi:hypothetical protein
VSNEGVFYQSMSMRKSEEELKKNGFSLLHFFGPFLLLVFDG